MTMLLFHGNPSSQIFALSPIMFYRVRLVVALLGTVRCQHRVCHVYQASSTISAARKALPGRWIAADINGITDVDCAP